MALDGALARRVPVLVGLAVAGALAALGLTSALTAAEKARGQALYDGNSPLAARLYGHTTVLPAVATRCTNCHEAGAAGRDRYAPTLDASLAAQRPRRGGPPSAYDAARLCALLRDGIDPTLIVISAAMPRYTISDKQCLDLWSWLSQR